MFASMSNPGGRKGNTGGGPPGGGARRLRGAHDRRRGCGDRGRARLGPSRSVRPHAGGALSQSRADAGDGGPGAARAKGHRGCLGRI